MRIIKLNKRTARLLRENLTNSQEGYDYLDLVRLDNLAKRLTTLQGDYAEGIAEVTREEKKLRRELVRATTEPVKSAIESKILNLRYEVDDLDEDAEKEEVEFRLEDGDYKLVSDKVASVKQWLAADSIRPLVISMVTAINEAEKEGTEEEEPVKLRKRK